jgi:hypothetical protein
VGYGITDAQPLDADLTAIAALTPTANKFLIGNGTTWVTKPAILSNGSTAQQTFGASEAYVTGSTITVAAGDFTAGTTYKCTFDMTKTAAGVAAPIVAVKLGTAGTALDTTRATMTFNAQTAAVDSGTIEIWVNFRAVGASAIIQANGRITHFLANTGLSTANASTTFNTSAAFSSTTATKIGISFNGGTAFSGTTEMVQAEYEQP